VSATELVELYFELWKTTDDNERHALAGKIFTDAAVQYAVPANVSFSGVDQIEANIAKVNKDNIQQAGLQFHAGNSIANHNSVQIEWSVAAPNGKTVGTGRDFLLLDEDGRVTALYMFMGQG
jgi:hypothetical protein